MSRNPTAAALVIGNELLTGKVQDENVAALARLLFELGISLDRVVMCPDEVDAIVSELDPLRKSHDYVFTSGGVGPTHDDVTMAAVSRSFGRPIVRSAEIEDLLSEYFGERLASGHLRMAEVPEGATLVRTSEGRWPTIRLENVYVLPGLPEIFRKKLAVLREHLVGGTPYVSRSVATASDEVDLAPLLDDLVREHPGVAIGSYPRWGEGPVKVAVTFDGRDRAAVERAVEALRQALPPDRIVDLGG